MPIRRKPAQIPLNLIKRIAVLIFNGFDNFEISALTGLSENAVRLIRNGSSNPDVIKAVLNLKFQAIERIKRGRGKLTGLVWFMERRYPKQYANPALQLQFASGSVTNNTLIVSAEVAEDILKRSKSTLGEIDRLIADKKPTAELE